MNWRDAKKELPQESVKNVVVYTEYTKTVNTYEYSAVHKLFNCADYMDTKTANDLAIEIDKWCYIEDLEV